MKIEVLVNPAIDVFMGLVKSSKEQLFASPFVKNNITNMVIENRPKDAQISLLTSYKLTNFYRGSSDLQALSDCIKNNIEVKSYSRLHAKTYIFDSQKAIVTSANLTLGGMQNNYECGVIIEDKEIVKKLKSGIKTINEKIIHDNELLKREIALRMSISNPKKTIKNNLNNIVYL